MPSLRRTPGYRHVTPRWTGATSTIHGKDSSMSKNKGKKKDKKKSKKKDKKKKGKKKKK
jgi:hypothetical protein